MTDTLRMKDQKQNFRNVSYNSPEPVYATQGSFSGELFLHWDAVKNAGKYIIEMSRRKTNGWEQVDIIKDPKYCLTGLKPGKEYLFRVAAVFPGGKGPWSSEIVKKVK